MFFKKRVKWYQITSATVKGNEVKVRSRFDERYDAVEYMMKTLYYGKDIKFRIRHTVHDIEYYIDDYHRFTVSRVLAIKH